MSVTYYLNKRVRTKDLKEKGFDVKIGEDAGKYYSIIVESKTYYTDKETGNGAWIGIYKYLEDEDGSLIFTEAEGHTGIAVITEICEKFDAKYFTDDDLDIFFHERNTDTLGKEDYDWLCDCRMKLQENPQADYFEIFNYKKKS